MRTGVDTDREVRTTYLYDDWVYNFGPNYFVLYLYFENGRLDEIESGGYGY